MSWIVPVHAQLPRAGTLQLGGNVNENPDWLTPQVLAQTHTTWVRAFIPASEFMSGSRSYTADPGLQRLRDAAKSGHKVMLSIKWDYKHKGTDNVRVPAPDSAAEKASFQFADDLLAATRGSIALFVTINELTIDTPNEDLVPASDGQIPMVRFQQRLIEHIANTHPTGTDGKPLPLYTGGFTRVDQPAMQANPAVVAMIHLINQDRRIAGCDYHLHQPDYETSATSLAFMHKAVPAKPLAISEFSLIQRWTKNLPDLIGAGPGGPDFLKTFSLPAGTTVLDFFNLAYAHPVPEAEWNAFLQTQSWYEPDYLTKIGAMMQNNGVTLATYALTINPLDPRPRHLGPKTQPWFLNDVLIPGLAASPDPGRLPENPPVYSAFVRWQQQHPAH